MDAGQGNRKDKLVFWGTCSIYGLFFLFLFSSFSSHNILHFKLATKPFACTIYPIRWNLYTKTSGEKVLGLYQLDKNRHWEAMDMRPFTPRFLYGFKRDYKIVYQELAIIEQDTSLLSKTHAIIIKMPKGGDINQYVNADTLKFPDVSPANVFYLKGKCLVTIGSAISWQQAKQHADSVQTIKIYPMNIVAK